MNEQNPTIKITRTDLEHLLFVLEIPNRRVESKDNTSYFSLEEKALAIFRNGKAELLDPTLVEKAKEYYEFLKG